MADAAPASEVLTLDKPEQLKALGHPLRLRVLEMLGADGEEPMTNRELAQRLGVDPGHLHFHVKMLLNAGLIERAVSGRGREKPYRALAKTVRVAPQLLHSSLASNLQAAMLEEVQRGFEVHQRGGFRSAQVTVRLSPEKALELLTEFVEKAQDADTPEAEPLVFTAMVHPASRTLGQ
jgi:DNA-binding transcriptional ArsR family regulator